MSHLALKPYQCRSVRAGALKAALGISIVVGGAGSWCAVAADGSQSSTAGTPAAPAVTSAAPVVQAGPPLKIGDKLKIAFYERFDDDESKWSGHTRTPDAGFRQFVELCGEYAVQDDGAISLPILGQFPAAGRSTAEVIAALTTSFNALVGRTGYVNVVSVEHQPVFVVGAVKNSGAYKFWQGMTVLHAIALAGGPKVTAAETWQSVESVREAERLQRSLARVKRLLVRTSLLRVEGGAAPVPNQAMKQLVGSTDVATLTSAESAARKLTTEGQVASASALDTAIESARRDVKARTDRLAPLDALIGMRQEREHAMLQLVAHDTVSSPVLAQVQSELADAQDRKRQALIDVAAAKDRLADAQQEASKQHADAAVEVANTTLATERDAQDAASDAQGALDLVQALAPRRNRSGLADSYQVVRHTAAGTETLTLPGTAALEPGDLVKLTDDDPADSQ